jgi:ParB family chromosome partitioning protein
MEEAEAFERLLARFGCTQEELAQRVGKERSSIANALRLLRLPAPIQDDLRSGRLTMGHARALLALGTPAEQLKLRDEILAHDWSVRATEDTVRTATAGRPRKPKQRRRSAEMTALEESLQRSLMTRVRIVGNDRQGRIEITYANADELERLAALLSTRH